MSVPELLGRVVGTVLGALVMLAARPIARLMHDWDG